MPSACSGRWSSAGFSWLLRCDCSSGLCVLCNRKAGNVSLFLALSYCRDSCLSQHFRPRLMTTLHKFRIFAELCAPHHSQGLFRWWAIDTPRNLFSARCEGSLISGVASKQNPMNLSKSCLSQKHAGPLLELNHHKLFSLLDQWNLVDRRLTPNPVLQFTEYIKYWGILRYCHVSFHSSLVIELQHCQFS